MSRPEASSARDLVELALGYGLILFVIWMPDFPQRILSPVALILTLAVVLARRPGLEELGLGWHGVIRSLWILPAAGVFAALSVFIAEQLGTLHHLYKGDLEHVTSYVLWTLYQQFLLNAYFMPRLMRVAGANTYLWALPHSYSQRRTCRICRWQQRLWYGERFRVLCSAATAISMLWAWRRGCLACASPSACPTLCIIICAWGWAICATTRISRRNSSRGDLVARPEPGKELDRLRIAVERTDHKLAKGSPAHGIVANG